MLGIAVRLIVIYPLSQHNTEEVRLNFPLLYAFSKFAGSVEGLVLLQEHFHNFFLSPRNALCRGYSNAPVVPQKRVVPCRCLNGHIKEPFEMSMALGARP